MEKEFIEEVFLLNGELKQEFRGIFTELEYIGYPYPHRNGGTYYANAEGRDFKGLGDSNGHYAYIRYQNANGNHKKRDNSVTVGLTMAICVPNCNDAVKAGLLLADYLMEAKAKTGRVLATSTIRSNRVKVWQEETALPAEKVRQDVALVAFDFDLQYGAPNSCKISDFACEPCST